MLFNCNIEFYKNSNKNNSFLKVFTIKSSNKKLAINYLIIKYHKDFSVTIVIDTLEF